MHHVQLQNISHHSVTLSQLPLVGSTSLRSAVHPSLCVFVWSLTHLERHTGSVDSRQGPVRVQGNTTQQQHRPHQHARTSSSCSACRWRPRRHLAAAPQQHQQQCRYTSQRYSQATPCWC